MLAIRLCCRVGVYRGGERPGCVESMGAPWGSGSCQCWSSLSLILRSAGVSSTRAGFSAVLRTGSARAGLAAALRPPPSPWIPAFAGMTVELGSVCAGTTSGVGCRVLRAPPCPWVPAPYRVRGRLSAGTTGELGSGCAPALLGRATPPPWVPAPYRVRGRLLRGNDGRVVWVPLCLRGNDGLSHPHPSPLPEGEGV